MDNNGYTYRGKRVCGKYCIMQIINNETVEIIQYDNPHVIILRDNKNYDYPKTEMNIDGKGIYKSVIRLKEGDIFECFAMQEIKR